MKLVLLFVFFIAIIAMAAAGLQGGDWEDINNFLSGKTLKNAIMKKLHLGNTGSQTSTIEAPATN